MGSAEVTTGVVLGIIGAVIVFWLLRRATTRQGRAGAGGLGSGTTGGLTFKIDTNVDARNYTVPPAVLELARSGKTAEAAGRLEKECGLPPEKAEFIAKALGGAAPVRRTTFNLSLGVTKTTDVSISLPGLDPVKLSDDMVDLIRRGRTNEAVSRLCSKYRVAPEVARPVVEGLVKQLGNT